MMRLTALLAILLFSFHDLSAQGIPRGQGVSALQWTPGMEKAVSPRARHGLLGDGSNDHRYEGMYTGLVLDGLLVITSLAVCGDPDMGCHSERLLLAVPVSMAFLGGVGALIGGAIPKHHPAAAH